MIKNIKNLIYVLVPTVFLGICFLIFGNSASAVTNISATANEHWAWNDIVGWMDFHGTLNINVSPSQMNGYASSSIGDISLDCATTRAGNICSGVNDNYKVVNDGSGRLSGWAWNDNYGWISFCGTDTSPDSNCPSVTNPYYVSINPNTGLFSGYAWNDIIGWISFNCVDIGACGTSDYKVVTSWVATSTSAAIESATFDTGVNGGAQINSFYWEGVQGTSTSVYFDFAASNSTSGPWNYFGNYEASAGLPRKKVNFVLHNNMRYFRYKITLVSDSGQQYTPVINKVVVDWSP